MSLKDKLSNSKVALVSLAFGTLLFTSGCETAMVNDVLNGMANQSAQQEMERERRLTERKLEREAGYNLNADNSLIKPESTQNIPGYIKVLDKEFGTLEMAACNYWKDFNNDGVLSFDEFRGLKKQFSKKERVEVIFDSNENIEAGRLKYELYGPDGKIVTAWAPDKKSYGIDDVYEPEKLKIGDYSAVVYSRNNNKVDRTLLRLDFSITKE